MFNQLKAQATAEKAKIQKRIEEHKKQELESWTKFAKIMCEVFNK